MRPIISFVQINTAKGILDTILSVQPKESSGGKPGETREAIVYKIAEDMLRKLPRDYVPHEIKEALIRLGGLLPMNIFLRQEIDRMQKILSIGIAYVKIFWPYTNRIINFITEKSEILNKHLKIYFSPEQFVRYVASH